MVGIMPSVITRDEAEQIAEQWVRDSCPPDVDLAPVVHEFDLGYVVWGRRPPGEPPLFGASRGIIDRETGELSVWPSLPLDMVVDEYRLRRSLRPVPQFTWHPTDQARRDLRRRPAPTNITHLTIGDETLIVRSVKGDDAPNHHPLVRDFLADELPREYRERGYDRCSEAAAFSDALHAADARRDSPITLEEARTALFAAASLVTYRVRERGDAVAGVTAPPCISCALLAQHFGFGLDNALR